VADDVTSRLAPLAAAHQRLEHGCEPSRARVVLAHEQLAALPPPQGVTGEDVGVKRCLGRLDAGLFEPTARVLDVTVQGVGSRHGQAPEAAGLDHSAKLRSMRLT
jgi:hypothetical protein